MHLTRYYMYKRIKEYFDATMRGNILGIIGIKNVYPFIYKSISIISEV